MEDRCICCGDIIPEGRQVCEACMKGENMRNNEGYNDPTPTQAMWGIRQEEKTRALERKHGVYRGEIYKVLVERPPDNAKSEKWEKKRKKMKVVGIYTHIVTLEDSKGFRESFRWNDFCKRCKSKGPII